MQLCCTAPHRVTSGILLLGADQVNGKLVVSPEIEADLPDVLIACGECGNTRDPAGSVVMWAFSKDGGKMTVEVYPEGKEDQAMSFEGPEVTPNTGHAGKIFIRELETGEWSKCLVVVLHPLRG